MKNRKTWLRLERLAMALYRVNRKLGYRAIGYVERLFFKWGLDIVPLHDDDVYEYGDDT